MVAQVHLSSPLLPISSILVGFEQRKTRVEANPISTCRPLVSASTQILSGSNSKEVYLPYNNNFLAVGTGWVETGSRVVQAAAASLSVYPGMTFELLMVPSLPPTSWDYRHAPLCPVKKCEMFLRLQKNMVNNSKAF